MNTPEQQPFRTQTTLELERAVIRLTAESERLRNTLIDIRNKACCVDGTNITSIKPDWIIQTCQAALNEQPTTTKGNAP